jgi:hypothetical protein
MDLCLIAISVGVIITALNWPLKTALFPVIIGIPVTFMALIDLFLNLFGRDRGVEKQAAFDFKLSEDVDQALAIRRTWFAFAWIMAFFLMILIFGFHLAVPLYVLLYLKIKGRERWGISLLLMASAWVLFYGLFVWLLDTPFHEGWIFKGLRAIGMIG